MNSKSTILGVALALSLAGCRVALVERASPAIDSKSGDIATVAFFDDSPVAETKPRPYEVPAAPAKPRPSTEPFELQLNVPGGNAPVPTIPSDQPPEERKESVRKLLRPIPPLPPTSLPSADEESRGLAIADLERIAAENSPVVQRAIAERDIAGGAAVQAGAHPNPTIGYEADTVNTLGTAGYHGGMITQEIVTAGKLGLAQSAAQMNVRAADIAVTDAQIDLKTDVRKATYSALVVRERIRRFRELAALIERAYEAHLQLVEGGEVAVYEALGLRVQAMAARNRVIQAESQYVAAWGKLAAAMGVADMSSTALADRADRPAPRVAKDAAMAWLLSHHTDLATAEARIAEAACQLKLQQTKPIPNVTVYSAIQKDFTGPPFGVTWNLQVGVPTPIFDRNTGNIASAEAALTRAQLGYANAKNALASKLSETYGRYESNVALVESFRGDILRDQIQSYRGAVQRYRQGDDRGISVSQLAELQKNLGELVAAYLNALDDQWQAVVDLADLLQLEEMGQLATIAGAALPPEP